jgi:(1->4)-alpha-D-glucan 1-alpha-D-glucosylmutase
MAESGPLRQLAALHGIEPAYHDIWGTRHEADAHALRALLACMDPAAADVADGALERRLRAAQRLRWREVLPPVIVRRSSRLSDAVPLRLPETQRDAQLQLVLTPEQGEPWTSPVHCGALPVLDTAHDDDGQRLALALPLPAAGMGYHRLALHRGGETLATSLLVVTPERCYCPRALEGEGRAWGPALQLYALRSERNWGIGDLSDLRLALEQWAARGADVIGLNPLHALFPHNPQHASPYSPSSRLFLNYLYLDVERVEDLRDSEEARRLIASAEFQARVRALRAAELVDYAGVAEVKLQVLNLLYASFQLRHLALNTDRAHAFRAFQQREGRALRLHATCEALQESMHRADPGVWGWPAWPRAYRDPAAREVAAFAQQHLDRIEFFEYLQWLADGQLGDVGLRSLELGLGVGLYTDLAVSADRAGAEVWADQALYAVPASIGAPPDEFALNGQNWGLPPLIPERLRAAAYAPFIATLRRNMQHSGALRIDHVMGLLRLFWIGPEMNPTQGAYVHYPLEDLLGILALESQRNRCLVIGEDLGTVPDELRAALHALGVLSYRLLYFEREPDGSFRAPAQYPAQALVAATTHDLPTLAGFWEGRDLQLRGELKLFPSEQAREQQVIARAEARARLLLALEREGLLPAGASADPTSLPEMTPPFARALHAFLARTPAKLMAVQLEDVLGVREQANLPGTTAEHPNWRRKLPLDVERWPLDERVAELAAALAQTRPRTRALSAARRPHPVRAAVIPRATYRLQLNRAFTLRDAADIVPYLGELGVSHVYCSPYLRARAGSSHGYDIIDHNALNPEIGSAEDFERFVHILKSHGMGQIFDMVPNHMGVMGSDNAWWLDLLENGQSSVYADFFDIDWNPADPGLIGKVLVPVLGSQYGVALESGELTLALEAAEGSFSLWYHAHRFPIDPREYPRILALALKLRPPQELDAGVRAEFESLSGAFGHLPPRDASSADRRAERNRDIRVHKRQLAGLLQAHPPLAAAVDTALHALNGVPGTPASFDALHELVEQQAYRLAYWRVASDEINYRRFFDINDLAALRMENEAVFEATHRLVLELLAAGKVDGLRIDHPDGLYDPAQYFRRLQERYAVVAGVAPPAAGNGADAAGGSARASRDWPLYLVIEKITAGHERVPESWPVYGTTGYRFANLVNGLFVDGAARSRLERTWRAFTGLQASWDETAYQSKVLIMRTALASELTVLSNQLLRIARADRRTRDFTFNTLRQALIEVVACLPVYRTYATEAPSPVDRRYVEWAVARAKRSTLAGDSSLLDFLRGVLLGEAPAGAAPELREAMRAFAGKLQQFTAPVTAKGIEDTAFYRYFPLASLNEVGGDPHRMGTSVRTFHGASRHRATAWRHTMLATTTHDTKRAEDARVRIDVLSEMPGPWRLALKRWSRLNRSHKRIVAGEQAPSRADEYLLYQTLVGSWPFGELDDDALAGYRARIEAYMLKAVREAKRHSSWINPDRAYEEALKAFVAALLTRRDSNLFLDDFAAGVRHIAWLGMLNGLSQALIKLVSPGVPDIYQGSELWDLSLVDPDNRRPVDYAHRRGLLEQIRSRADGGREQLNGALQDMLAHLADGRAKLYAIWRTLTLRREHADLFRHGAYLPLEAGGQHAAHLCAFARRHDDQVVIAVAPRLLAGLCTAAGVLPAGESVWGNTSLDVSALHAEAFDNLLDGAAVRVETRAGAGVLRVRDALARFPVALLWRQAG